MSQCLRWVHFVFVCAALSCAAAAHAESYSYKIEGTIESGAAPRAAFVNFACSPDADGALSIELVITDAYPKKDFDFDDFEGPEAAGMHKALSHLSWTSEGHSEEMTHTASGWYAPEPADSFMFGINQHSHRNEPPARFMAAIDGAAGKFVWTQTAFDDAKHVLVTSFNLDAAAAKKVHDTVSTCLPARPSHPRSKAAATATAP